MMMPIHANHYGSVHGGTIVKLVDEAAFVTATKHARKNVVMASMDHMVFEHPVNIGDMLNIRARISYVGRTSMEVEVKIEAEKLKLGKTVKVGSAHLTMVALDEKGRPTRVPRIILRTEADRLKSRVALARRKDRLSKRYAG
ncbi:MAG: acyl-CoA thioesterase [Candidatus Omnitrophica bacterium]|nr:acyl-CoA thioesterase [Candidatus Omnitrophota bacterium]MBI5143517.1 acyl-CoA thioesterase [Candidatus Omnitrophota bacterium]